MTKEYIGDSVYVDHDGYAFILTTENGFGPSNTIVLEPREMKKLQEYVLMTLEMAKAEAAKETP